jgi:serine/threonine-protein kinase
MTSAPASADSSDPRIGTLVADRYRLTAKLGEGGMGAVYRGVHEALRKPVALKFLVPEARGDKELAARFEREAVATANLKHPNISETTDYGQLPDGTLFLVMECIDGKDLRQLVAQGRLAPARALAIVKQIGAALSFAHGADVVHRDLKPANVIVYDRGSERDLVKVIDFGIARMTSAFGGGKTALTKVGSVFGTPDYMAPEQAMGQAVDARADQYALGAIVFELLTGKPPYVADNVASLMYMHVGAPIPRVTELVPELPARVADVVEKMMGKLPDERFASVDEALAALTHAFDAAASSPQVPPVVATVPQATPAPAPHGAPVPSSARGPASPEFPVKWLAAGAGALLVLVVGASLLFMVARRVQGSASSPSSIDRANVAAALVLWKSGRYAEGASALRPLLDANPGLEEDADVASTLSASVDDDDAKRQVDDLMRQTALGRSSAMAGNLADAAIRGGAPRRAAALLLLRDRHAQLSPEQRYRVELRDADDCAAVAGATSSLSALGSGGATEDLTTVRSGDCKGMLRRSQLCEECRGNVAGSSGGSAAGTAGNTASTVNTASTANTGAGGGGKSSGKSHGHGRGH